jgi:hypothetical protein
MQEHALQSFPGQHPIEGKVTILFVTDDRMTEMREMDANLVRAPGPQFCLEQAETLPARQQAEDRVRRPAFLGHAHAPFARNQQVLQQRQANMAQRLHPASGNQHQVTLVGHPPRAAGGTSAKHLVQGEQARTLLADQEDPRGLAIKPVRQFEESRLRPLLPQRLDDTEALAAATMNGDTGGLVDHQQGLVLIDDRQVQSAFGRHHHLFGAADAQRRNAQQVAALQAMRDFDAATIDPHLAAADNAVNVALWHPLAELQQQVVNPLAVLVLADKLLGDRVFANLGHFEYTSVDLRRRLKDALSPAAGERCRFRSPCGALSGMRQPTALRPAAQLSPNADHLVKFAHHKVAILLELRAPGICGIALATSRNLPGQGPMSMRVSEMVSLLPLPTRFSSVPETPVPLLPTRGAAHTRARGSPTNETNAVQRDTGRRAACRHRRRSETH